MYMMCDLSFLVQIQIGKKDLGARKKNAFLADASPKGGGGVAPPPPPARGNRRFFF